jgi:outer membrane protein
MRTALIFFAMCFASMAHSAELLINVANAPDNGRLVFQIYNNANSFGDFRDPIYAKALAAMGDGEYRLENIEAGKLALLVYFDENENGLIDKNFIGIPREQLALSNNYQPKGPPSFVRASFDLSENESRTLNVSMYRVLGKRGRWGLGIGGIGKSSPYVDSTQSVSQVIPAITYFGEKLQWFGPSLRYGIYGSGKFRLALSANYRIGSYEENDSPVLAGLGDRESTLMAGLGVQYELPYGFDVNITYEHDVLDRIGGGIADIGISRGLQYGVFRFRPSLSLNWVSSEVNDYEFGVPASSATNMRPAYSPGSSSSIEIGLATFVELSEDWRLVFNIYGERLDNEVTASPIVADDTVISGFAGITYTF